ncbi:MAG TPA: glycosyltransferase family 39 protein [Syntrophobacteraceae bacterium]|nr:glycosyltransferase family 39 protein [Syntrophobacteraceae bacterium]
MKNQNLEIGNQQLAIRNRDPLSMLSLAVLASAITCVIILRFQAAPAPLERDEGEYALMGQLILDGIPPYSEAANMKLPGIYYAYSAILALFGQTASGIRMGLVAVNLFSTVLLFLLALPMLGAAGAALAGAAFIVASAGTSVLGLFAHATQFVVMFALAGIWLLLRALKSSRPGMTLLWGSGLCLGLALLMKQSGVFFALFALNWVVYAAFRSRPVVWNRFLLQTGSLAAGIVLPYAVVLALMAYQGVLDRFWFWTVDYARSYASELDFNTGIQLLRPAIVSIIENNPVIWALGFGGMIGVWFTGSGRKVAPFLLAFFLFSFLSVCPGFFFRQHYFVQFLPAASLYAGAAALVIEEVAAKYTVRSKAVQFGMLVAVTAFSLTGVFSMQRVLMALTPDEFSRSVYGGNPFPESVKVAEFIRKNTKPQDRIAVLGSEPQICFYAHRRPATEHIYMYGLMEPRPFALRMQEELIAQVEKNEPPFLVLATASTSWLQRPESEKKLFFWMRDYINNYYQPVIVAAIYSDRTLWLMDKEAQSFPSGRGLSQLIVFKRKVSLGP